MKIDNEYIIRVSEKMKNSSWVCIDGHYMRFVKDYMDLGWD